MVPPLGERILVSEQLLQEFGALDKDVPAGAKEDDDGAVGGEGGGEVGRVEDVLALGGEEAEEGVVDWDYWEVFGEVGGGGENEFVDEEEGEGEEGEEEDKEGHDGGGRVRNERLRWGVLEVCWRIVWWSWLRF